MAAEAGGEAAAAGGGGPEQHRLAHTWTFFETKDVRRNATQREWDESLCRLADVSSVEEFWQVYLHMPRPSELFFCDSDQEKTTFSEGDTVASVALFKEGIRPEWEDPENKRGGEFTLRKTMQASTLNFVWEQLVLGLIGNTIDHDNAICGARVVDKSKSGRAIYKLELWLRTRDPQTRTRVESNLGMVLTDPGSTNGGGGGGGGGPKLRFEWKDH